MSKATWFFSDGSAMTLGATGDVGRLIEAGKKVAKRKALELIGWRFEFKVSKR